MLKVLGTYQALHVLQLLAYAPSALARDPPTNVLQERPLCIWHRQDEQLLSQLSGSEVRQRQPYREQQRQIPLPRCIQLARW